MAQLSFVMLYIVALLVVFCVGVAVINNLRHNKDACDGVINNVPSDCASCGEGGGRCEQECLMEAAAKDIVYFDDEELDAFQGRPSDGFSDDEAEMFSEVMYTMRQKEVKEWCRSLTLRGINLPDQLKDEVILLIEN